jgi:hypothetical protein
MVAYPPATKAAVSAMSRPISPVSVSVVKK